MYEWIEAGHVISVVCWFAALFYLPRLFVYHSMAEDKTSIERFKVMEHKLSRAIATPSMIATIIFGSWLFAMNPDYFLNSAWFYVKMTLVALLIIYHHMCLYYMRQLKEDRNIHSHTFFRWFNEAPVLLLIGIIIMVIVRPF